MHLMVDIETLGKSQTSVVIQVAFLPFRFDWLASVQEVYDRAQADGVQFNLGIAHQLPYLVDGRLTIDEDTLQWWTAPERVSLLNKILEEMYYGIFWEKIMGIHDILDRSYDGVWAKSPQFDLSILSHYLGVLNNNIPEALSDFRRWRDVRTLVESSGIPKLDLPPGVDKHWALNDCVRQVAEVLAADCQLKMGGA